MSYRIKTVAELTGIPKNTLLAWERRYQLLEPARLENGYRVYSEADVALLMQIKRALADGLRISEAVERVQRPRPVVAGAGETGLAALSLELERALCAFDNAAIDAVMTRMVGIPHLAAIEQVYFPLLRRVGDEWERGNVTVAQEHHATAFVRQQLSGMLLGLGGGQKYGPRVACTTFPGDPHEIGVMGLAVWAALMGCLVIYLGASVPVAELASFAREQQPAWICVSVILAVEEEALHGYCDALSGAAPMTSLALGGTGLPSLSRPAPPGVVFIRDWHDLELHRAAPGLAQVLA
jgi:MerR family transcriptional regulator, light-induced transcriptional regulator